MLYSSFALLTIPKIGRGTYLKLIKSRNGLAIWGSKLNMLLENVLFISKLLHNIFITETSLQKGSGDFYKF